MISDDDKHLMMIEPQGNCEPAIDDEITDMAIAVHKSVVFGDRVTKGFHVCKCGAVSDNQIWTLPSGRVTNSLMVHYIKHHRSEVPESEIMKLRAECQARQSIQ